MMDGSHVVGAKPHSNIEDDGEDGARRNAPYESMDGERPGAAAGCAFIAATLLAVIAMCLFLASILTQTGSGIW